MSSKFRNCRRSLTAALDQAAEEVPNLSSSSSPNNCSQIRTSQHVMNEDFQCCTPSAKLQDLCGLLDVQTLEDLVAKLEFENELNRVYSRFLQSKNQDRGKNTESVNSEVEEGSTGCWVHDSKEEYSFLLDMILEIERDNDFTADCDVSALERDLQLSP
ncbi:hypothetical protein G5714_011685 [Onychostoma macrolepis]|uniref:Uncharacterized protein n=1 Tax=Onychostoma macrolepis TaxID=369639 RepID=A0A7J6CJH6_9TELE|nr:hypothetical protein G5714_011685 [Onychostoma macrolepis]